MRILALSVWSAGIPSAVAVADDTPVRMDPRFDIDRNLVQHPFKDEVEAAWNGDCAPLLAAIDPETLPPRPLSPTMQDWKEETALRLNAAVDLYDRGLCVERDPTRASELAAFSLQSYSHPITYIYALEIGFPGDKSVDYGWRLWHGYGLPRDRDAARTAIESGLLRSFQYFGQPDHADRTWRGETLPSFAAETWRWISGRTGSPEEEAAFGLELALDGVARPDGSIAGPDLENGYIILQSIWSTKAKNYALALLWRSGKLGPERQDNWPDVMKGAALCGNVDAAREMITHEYDKATQAAENPRLALAWLWILDDAGVDSKSKIREIADRFDMPSGRADYADTIAALLKEKDCLGDG